MYYQENDTHKFHYSINQQHPASIPSISDNQWNLRLYYIQNYALLGFLTFEDGTNKLSRNIGKELLILAV
jgi:hypothetical protein